MRLPEQVAADIRKRVLRHEIRAGDVLPPETEFMAQYGISRPTLREALRILEAERFVVVRRGGIGGAVVQRPDLDVAARQFGFVLQDRGINMADVHHARSVIEPPALAALAKTVTVSQLSELNEMLTSSHAFIGQPLQYSHAAEMIRARIVEMTGAITIGLLLRMLRELVERHRSVAGGIPPERWANLQKLSLRSHQRLVELIGEGEPAAAETFWRHHLVEVEHHLGRLASTRVVDILE